jgi:cation-transporting P-type ATPase E
MADDAPEPGQANPPAGPHAAPAPTLGPPGGLVGQGSDSRVPARSPDDWPRGLSSEEVEERVRSGLVNRAPAPPGRTLGQIVRANVLTRFNAILGALLVVVAIVGPPQDGLFGAVLVANTGIGIIQELRARHTLDRLAILTAPRARVVRNSGARDCPVEEVVVDDLLELQPGDQVPVDAVVRASSGLEVDESLLTGEAQPAPKETDSELLSGSFVVSGSGQATARRVGDAAYATRLESQARQFRLLRSELQQGTNRILRAITWVIVPVSAALVPSLVFRSGESLDDALRGTVAGVGALVPEGLVLLTSLAFAVGAIRLARQRVLVQELAAIEGLARVDVVCIDKTGTLTSPGMQLESIEALAGRSSQEVNTVLGALAAGDPAPNATMQALSRACPADPGWQVVARVPFSSHRKWGATTFAGQGTWVLGGPDVIGRQLLDTDLRAALGKSEAGGARVLLLAEAARQIEGDQLPGLTPVALVVLAEALRPDTRATVRYLLDQGVAVKVLSGDAPQTVAAIAGQAGIPDLGEPCDGSERWARQEPIGPALLTTNVVGRVRPEQKLEAVRELQEKGHVVAMVGDGVNDVPALKQADLGVAMGSGSASTRAVARIVLLDSRFAAVPPILGEGRRVIANIERVASLFVTKTVYAALLAIVVAASALPFPFFARHLTIVSALTIGIPGFFLALASGAPRASPGFVARVCRFSLPIGVAAAAATLGAYALARTTAGITPGQARTLATLALFAMGMWVLVLVARPLAGWRLGLLVAMVLCMGGVLALPLARHLFSLELPPVKVALPAGAVVAVVIGLLTCWRAWHAARAARRA